MEVKIGVQHAPRELVFEVSESVEEVEKIVNTAVAEGGVLSLTDSKNRRILVAADKVIYVEIGGGVGGQVGFRG